MSKRRLVITAVLAGATQSEVARTYGVSQGWISRLMARYREEGETVFEPTSRAPKTSPTATPTATVDLVLQLRKELTDAGHDAGADTIGWHLAHHHGVRLSRATIHRILTRHGTVTPEPNKRPKSSYIRFEAEQPNETWQSDFTHYRLARTDDPAGTNTGVDVEVITWLDDHSRYALHISAHPRITATIVAATFTETAGQHGYPASTLTDNGMVYTVRLAGQGRRGGRTHLEAELRRLGIRQKNSRPGHPTTCGKVERFQQTMKNWLRAQPAQPRTLAQLQTLLDTFRTEYNQQRPHRSLAHRATPATAYTARPKASPGTDRSSDTHDRVLTSIIDSSGTVTARVNGRLHHIGIGRTHARTHVIVLIQDLHARVVNAATGELLRDLVIDPTRDYQPTGRPPGPTKTK
ncbi:IS481 family transposase [Nocardioides sp. BGMRC 2183]|nr:IS481 family transposase [Nocardioides sp. BGMRC 2183]